MVNLFASRCPMKGCRPFSETEVPALVEFLSGGRYPARDRALFIAGVFTGFRISELLSLRIRHVIQKRKCVEDLIVEKKAMKGKKRSRGVPLHPIAQAALVAQIEALERAGHTDRETFLFRSRNGENQAISRVQAWTLLTRAYAALNLTGKLGTHGMRKTFAKQIYELVGHDLMKLQELMGHARITSTTNYLSFNKQDLRDAVLKQR